MTKIIGQLWNGNLEPARYVWESSAELKHLAGLMCRNSDNLREGLSEKQSEILEKLNDCTNEYIGVITELAFCSGFSLGAKIAVEAMSDAEQMLEI